MTQFVCCSSLESAISPILTQVVEIQLRFVSYGASYISTPELNGVIWRVVEESRIVLIGPHGEPIDLPTAGIGAHQEAVEAEPHVGTFAYIDEPAGAIFQFLPAESRLHRSPRSGTANLQKPCLEIKLLLINWPRPSRAPRVNAALQLDECTN